MQLRNLSPYTAQLYPAQQAEDPFYWICVLKASFHFDRDGTLSLLKTQIPICEYDHYYPHVKAHYLHASHETMPYKQGAEYLLLWQQYEDTFSENQKCYLQFKNATTHIKSTRKLWQLGYLSSTHPQRRWQQKQNNAQVNVAPYDQRIHHAFSGGEKIAWWWQTSCFSFTLSKLTTLSIPKLPINITTRTSHAHQKHTLPWDTLCVIVDQQQCSLLGRLCFICSIDHFRDGEVLIES